MLFHDRRHAGRLLAERLTAYRGHPNVLVLGLPRGGVPVAYEVARALAAPLDVFIVRKLGLPGHEELAMGAVASNGTRVLNDDVVRAYRISHETLDAAAERELQEIRRRERAYREDRTPPEFGGKTLILVDDGLATGSTMRAAVRALRQHHPAKIVVAVPVAASSTCDRIGAECDEIVCLSTPEPFYAVGLWYDDFAQTTDDDVRQLLAESPHPSEAT